MRYKLLLCCVFCTVFVGDMHARTSAKKKKEYVKLLEANVQRTLPGIPGVPITTQYHLLIIWKATTYPKAFFWRGENGWLPCGIAKFYSGRAMREITNGKVHSGDTLQLTPMSGGKFPVPVEVSPDTRNTLFYKTGSSPWLSCPVKKINTLPDVVNP